MHNRTPTLPLSPGNVLPSLPTKIIGRRYLWVVSCDSTNDLAAGLAQDGEPEGLVVVADSQTRGRGHLGRSWHSPAGVNLYLSILLRPAWSPDQARILDLLAGVVLAEVARETGVVPLLKWPNDLLLTTPDGPRKAAGVLTEMVTEFDCAKYVVVGIGVDVNMLEIPPALEGRATSIARVVGREIDRRDLLIKVLSKFETEYLSFCRRGPRAVLAKWRRFAMLGQRCRIVLRGSEREGTALNVAPDGALRFRDDAGAVHRLTLSEVEIGATSPQPRPTRGGPSPRPKGRRRSRKPSCGIPRT